MKHTLPISAERWAAAAFLTLVAGLFAGVAVASFSSSLALCLVVAAACPLAFTAQVARRLPVDFDGSFGRRRALSALWLLVAALAVARLAGLALFMVDPTQPQLSPMWFDPFYLEHSCFSAWWKAARLVAANTPNIYDIDLYGDYEGRFNIDEYLYPPQFLILPQAMLATGADFLQIRAGWYAAEGLLFLVAMLALCAWIGGGVGRRAALWTPAVWLASPVLMTLQTGNFQLAALSMSVLAMTLFERRRFAAGGALLGFAVLKIFPGVLCAYLLFARRWRALAWTVGFTLAYTAIAAVTVGPKPFHAFIDLVLPRMAGGELWWSWLDAPDATYVSTINDSIPALILKLKVLGVQGIDHHMLSVASTAWSLVVVACAWLAARNAPAESRWSQGACWIGLLGLAALRSPFVPDQYGLLPALWIWSLLPAVAGVARSRIALVIAAWAAFAMVVPFSRFRAHGLLDLAMAWSTASQLLMVGLLLWVIVRLKRVHRDAPAAALPARRATAS